MKFAGGKIFAGNIPESFLSVNDIDVNYEIHQLPGGSPASRNVRPTVEKKKEEVEKSKISW
jgi:hypothetical protein